MRAKNTMLMYEQRGHFLSLQKQEKKCKCPAPKNGTKAPTRPITTYFMLELERNIFFVLDTLRYIGRYIYIAAGVHYLCIQILQVYLAPNMHRLFCTHI